MTTRREQLARSIHHVIRSLFGQESPCERKVRHDGASHDVCQTENYSRAAKRGGSNGGLFPIWTCPSFFVLFCPFWDFPDFSGIFPICSGTVRGFSRLVLFLFLGLLRAPTRNSPERVRDTIWTFPEKSGKHPGLETPRFSFSQESPCERKVRYDGASHDVFQTENNSIRLSRAILWRTFLLRSLRGFGRTILEVPPPPKLLTSSHKLPLCGSLQAQHMLEHFLEKLFLHPLSICFVSLLAFH